MSDTLYNSTWPANWMEQALLIEKIQRTKQQVMARKGVVEIRSWKEPTESEWESAFLEQFGILPPIPPGTTLRWIQKGTQLIRQYTTAFDSLGGAVSSGGIYPQAKIDYDNNAFRYLGTMTQQLVGYTTAGSYKNMSILNSAHKSVESPYQYTSGDTAPRLCMPDYKTWLQKGLVGLWIMLRFRHGYSTTSYPIYFYLGTDYDQDEPTPRYIASYSLITNSARTPGSSATLPLLGNIWTANDSAQDDSTWLNLYITRPTSLWDYESGEEKSHDSSQIGYFYGFNSQYSSLVTCRGMEVGMIKRLDTAPTKAFDADMYRFNFGTGNTEPDYNLCARGYVYGYFNNNKQGTVEELAW